MKNFVLALLPLAVSSATIRPRVPQSASSSIPAKSPLGPLESLLSKVNGTISESTIASLLPKAKLAKLDHVEPQLRQGAKRSIARYGPYILAGKGEPKQPGSLTNSLDPNGQAFLDVISEGLCTNCTVLRGKTAFIFEDGSEAGPSQGIYVHHVVNKDISKPANLPISKCAPNQQARNSLLRNIGSEFLAQGDDGLGTSIYFTSNDGNYDSGFYIGANDQIMNQIDLVNYNDRSRNIYITFDVEYVSGHAGSDAAATLMSVTGCENTQTAHAGHEGMAHSGIKLNETGIAVTESPNFPITANGKIVSAMGHMHDGGSKMILFINNKEVCSSEAIYGKGGDNNYETITQMSQCPNGIPFKKGDVLSMHSVYDLPKHPLRNGGGHNTMGMADVMGMFYLTFAVDEVSKA